MQEITKITKIPETLADALQLVKDDEVTEDNRKEVIKIIDSYQDKVERIDDMDWESSTCW